MRKDRTIPDHRGAFDLYFAQRHPDPTLEAIMDQLGTRGSANLADLFIRREAELKSLRGQVGKDQLQIMARQKFRFIGQKSEELGGIPEGRLMIASLDNLRASKNAEAKKLASKLFTSHKSLIRKWRKEEKIIRERQHRKAEAIARKALAIKNANRKGKSPEVPTTTRRRRNRK